MTRWQPKTDKEANAHFRRLMDREVAHIRLGQRRGDDTWVALVGTLADLHGPQGVCTCCPRRRR